ncbi:YcjF family protein [Synechococcus sp. CS-1332]|uniref:YcjF family protein n=1 Tax=Synechococcus sp. CS-1332 TaxID=2847972 RepID=UPI00223AD0DE|nr:YcjF family protein [Synechococcus sp. CS-1332]
MTPQDPLRPAALSSLLRFQLSAGWGRQALLLAGGVLGGELMLRSLPGEGWGLMGVAGIAAGWWWLGRRPSRLTTPRLPSSFEAWLRRCDDLLRQFERLEVEPGEGQARRRAGLAALREEGARSGLQLALVGCVAPDAAWAPQLQQALRGPLALSLRWGHALPAVSQERRWPDGLAAADVVLFQLMTPLRAADLRWLEAVPAGQPVWLLVQPDAPSDPQALAAELASQWPAAVPERLLPWDGNPETLTDSLQPLGRWLNSEAAALRRATPLRRSEELHRHWQADLERLRRQQLVQLQRRTQWLVAAGVFAAPLPSLDLVVLAAANGLMLQEMARLWDCPWNAEQLKAAAVELAKASLLLGVVEWSSQALSAAVRLHGATWLVGGALQALSAAYLTRVVSHAMADVLALSAGVEAPDLERIKREAPLLVARAAEAEKLDWPGFLQQGRDWLGQQLAPPASGSLPASS